MAALLLDSGPGSRGSFTAPGCLAMPTSTSAQQSVGE